MMNVITSGVPFFTKADNVDSFFLLPFVGFIKRRPRSVLFVIRKFMVVVSRAGYFCTKIKTSQVEFGLLSLDLFYVAKHAGPQVGQAVS